ncbi:MAG: valine--tRNA ligase [Candidatus Altiarchaeia archaeon]
MVIILDKTYDFRKLEEKWIKKWNESGVNKFDAAKQQKVYSFDTPPPFTSGTLHMGHIYNHTWIDIIARYKRMTGYNVYLPQGFDCHGLPTEQRVEKEFKIRRDNREEFLAKCKEWTDTAIARMKTQFNSIGYSTDWDYTYRTMDDSYKAMVQKTLLIFHEKNLLYREKHPILWCPKCGTALAKAEIGYVEKEGRLYHIDLESDGHKLAIATTRPEMMSACVAVLVNPTDARYTKFVGKKAKLPLYEREVPIIADDAVDKEFGTGVVYTCTFGDEQDMAWQKKYKLPVIEAIDKRGKMTQVAGKYAGMNAEEARKTIAEDLEQTGVIRKIDDLKHNVLCHVERSNCKAPIELLPMEQWFIKVRESIPDIVAKAKEMNWYPDYMLQRLTDWTEAMDWDWIISRQRVFGTPIPFWVCECGAVMPATKDELPIDPRGTTKKCPKCGGVARGETDVCDCWVDSSVSPLRVTKWDVDSEFHKKTYPASLRPQGYEIIRTWTFYTIYRNLILTDKACFKDLCINGMVCGPDGRKMSKSLGNVVAPEEPMKKYSADSIRQWAAGGTLGEDYPFSFQECEHSQKFMNKLWNIAKFMEMHLADYDGKKPEKLNPVDRWILSRLQVLIENSTVSLDRYTFNAPISDIRSFIWRDLADNYLEMVKHRLYKPEIYGVDERKSAQYTMSTIISTIIRMMYPFTPFISDELRENLLNEDCAKAPLWPIADPELLDKDGEELGEIAKDIVAQIRKYKSDKGVSLGSDLESVEITCGPEYICKVESIKPDVEGTGKIKKLEITCSEDVEKFILKFS